MVEEDSGRHGETFQKSNLSNAVFLALVHKIAGEKRHLLTTELGSDEERRQVWEFIKKSPCLTAVGEK